MIFAGAIVNALAIIVGGLLGMVLTFIPEHIKDAIMKIQGVFIIAMGIQMVVGATDILTTLISLIIGVVVGEVIQLEKQLNRMGHLLEYKLGDKHGGNISQGLISGMLIFIVGAMGIVGGLDAGLRGNNDVLYTKSAMDFFIALVMTAAYGRGVIFSGIPTFIYTALIIISARLIAAFIPEGTLNLMIDQVSATGGVILLAIGLNMLNVTAMRVGNMIPAIFIGMILVWMISFF
ncbi:DUF554 domain-containing protein [Jeotgalicoccus sp. ATCC 8456]|uniref:DUF554 domain-containing protein n=1 Tax=Jeotgalicoccus sp. ATCC 8456 TaxID=946435 RepID=UPI0018E5CD67|nr:DUF554 domain-containing protein [Jeotgalicoccus sp. ATCC 8456]QQD85758.1 DUF554 domain-containing protein [Jeotgalicoccus sp. ATCC 8456]